MISITLSARQFVTVRAACWYTRSSVQRRRSQLFLLMLWHFSIISKTQTPACWRSRRMRWKPKPRPRSPSAPLWTLPHLSYLLLPLIYVLCFASQGQFHIELLENPHVCWKASFTGTQQPFQPDMRFGAERLLQAFNLSCAWKMTRRKERVWREERFFPWCLERCQRGLEAVLERRRGQTEPEHIFLAWQTGRGLSCMFSIQITIVVRHWTAPLFWRQWTIYCDAAVKWSVRPLTAITTWISLPNAASGNECFAHFYYVIKQTNGRARYISYYWNGFAVEIQLIVPGHSFVQKVDFLSYRIVEWSWITVQITDGVMSWRIQPSSILAAIGLCGWRCSSCSDPGLWL